MSGYLQQPVNGYILAGGKSSRMGQDKGLMLFNQKPLVQYVLQSLQTVVNKVIIVANNPAYEQFGAKSLNFRPIYDEAENINTRINDEARAPFPINYGHDHVHDHDDDCDDCCH